MDVAIHIARSIETSSQHVARMVTALAALGGTTIWPHAGLAFDLGVTPDVRAFSLRLRARYQEMSLYTSKLFVGLVMKQWMPTDVRYLQILRVGSTRSVARRIDLRSRRRLPGWRTVEVRRFKIPERSTPIFRTIGRDFACPMVIAPPCEVFGD